MQEGCVRVTNKKSVQQTKELREKGKPQRTVNKIQYQRPLDYFFYHGLLLIFSLTLSLSISLCVEVSPSQLTGSSEHEEK